MTFTSTSTTRQSLNKLILGAIGVVYGDIGTSPLYAIKECFSGPHPLSIDELHVLGVLSLVFWAAIISVTFKYVILMMRADNHGEGGSLALLALVTRITKKGPWASTIAILGIFAAALFYGDSMLTPAISVLSAVEGLKVVAPALSNYIIPITIIILTILFMIQRQGTASMGVLFGPIMCLWFAVLAILGFINILAMPSIFIAINPYYAFQLFMIDSWMAFLALGSVVLVLTGAEALYSDMGHFGKKPIRSAWLWFILPALLLNYFGQGALLLTTPDSAKNPFFLMAPQWALVPLLLLATAAAVIASQAVITGAFSVTRQAIQLKLLPRITTIHTSSSEVGQIYVPFINWILFISVIALVLGFQSSSHLAAAYGLAVTGTMLIDSLLISVVMFTLWKWNKWTAAFLSILFITIDFAFFAANSTKILHGGWFPLVIGLTVFTLLTTWQRGRLLLTRQLEQGTIPMEVLLKSLDGITRVPGTAIFMTTEPDVAPAALLHNLKHNKVIHERMIILTVYVEDYAHVPENQRAEVHHFSDDFYRVELTFGYLDDLDVPLALNLCKPFGLEFDLMETSYFMSRETLIPSSQPGMALWREALFAWMVKNAATAMSVFNLPPNRVVELGQQIEI
jgi:KUP system potassium uptake protein